ncbi:MAG TPA: ABC transporter ATP-binding protein [Gaiellaceae bacterium]|nr:ABC transporter ATP-binding protein [Gaiellaceae bacterium]
MTGAQPLVRAHGLARRFGARVALDGVDFELLPGEIVALVGPNGAGKSTLLSVLAGAVEPSGGTVEWADGTRAGWVPQRAGVYARLTSRENLELFARLEGEDVPAAEAARLLEAFDLPPDVPASLLSVGNRQRLNVAVALIGRPDALLLDEPTASLDPGHRRRLWEVVAEVGGRGGAVVFSTQNLEEVERHAARCVALRDGVEVRPEDVWE